MVNSLDILESERNWMSLNCTAHCLQLCLKSGFDIPVINRLLAAVRKLVNHSVVATEALKKKHLQMNTECNTKFKKLIKDCTTRWNSSYFMLQRILQLRWPISAVLSDNTITKRNDQYLDLKSDQWILASDLIEPFDVATTFFSYEENPSLSCVLPILHGIIKALSYSNGDSPCIQQFKDKVSNEIKRKWSFDHENILIL